MSEEVTLSAKMTPEQLADFEEFSSFRRALSSESHAGVPCSRPRSLIIAWRAYLQRSSPATQRTSYSRAQHR